MAHQQIRQYRKERLISLNLSLLLNWRFDVTEKDSLTLFFSDGISPPSDYAKLSNYLDTDAPEGSLFDYNVRKLKM